MALDSTVTRVVKIDDALMMHRNLLRCYYTIVITAVIRAYYTQKQCSHPYSHMTVTRMTLRKRSSLLDKPREECSENVETAIHDTDAA